MSLEAIQEIENQLEILRTHLSATVDDSDYMFGNPWRWKKDSWGHLNEEGIKVFKILKQGRASKTLIGRIMDLSKPAVNYRWCRC